VSQSWSIIIFLYNEEDSLKAVIDSSLIVLEQLNATESELIIVNDGSTDKSKQMIENYINNDKIKVIHHDINKGIGEALISGYKAANYENICAIPADGQFNVDELLPFKIIPDKTIISFYRNQKTRYTLFRKFLSLFNKLLNKYLLGIKVKDVNWIKIYKKDFFNNISPVLTSSLVESEICAKMLKTGFKIIEVESKYHPRLGGKSKGASYNTISQAIRETFKLYIELRKSHENKSSAN